MAVRPQLARWLPYHLVARRRLRGPRAGLGELEQSRSAAFDSSGKAIRRPECTRVPSCTVHCAVAAHAAAVRQPCSRVQECGVPASPCSRNCAHAARGSAT